MKYNPAVRKNILLQEMTAYTNLENAAFSEALATVEQLDATSNDELTQALVAFMRSLVHDNIVRSNQVRNALNTFFDETGELDEDTYLLFKPYEVVEPTEEPVVEVSETIVEDKEEESPANEAEAVEDEASVDESEEDVDADAETETEDGSESEVVQSEVSEEDAEVLSSLPDDNENEDEDVNVITDVFGTTEEELNTRERAEALSSIIELPDSL